MPNEVASIELATWWGLGFAVRITWWVQRLQLANNRDRHSALIAVGLSDGSMRFHGMRVAKTAWHTPENWNFSSAWGRFSAWGTVGIRVLACCRRH